MCFLNVGQILVKRDKGEVMADDEQNSVENSTEAAKTVVNCEPTIDISSAQTLYDHLKNALSNNHDVEIDASEVTRVDTAILQVFTAFFQELKSREQRVTWTGVSDAFYTSAKLLGLVNELNLPEKS